MGRCFLRFLVGRILLIAGLGPFFAELRIDKTVENFDFDFPSAASTTNSKAFLLLAPVEALSTTPSSPRRPPRIRPKRESPIGPSSDEASYRISGDSQTAENRQEEAEQQQQQQQQPLLRRNKHEEALQDPSLLTGIYFADRTDMHPCTKEALAKGFGLQTMTRVQASTYEAALQGRSILARSKTGSGKTLAFLLPTLERLLDPEQHTHGRSIGCVVLAPTRELAIQIADQAELLVGFHNQHRPSRMQLRVACIYGGVKMQRDVRLLMGDQRGGGMGDLPTILVATPSRLLEHLEGNSPLNKNGKNTNRHHIITTHSSSRRSKSKFSSVVAETKIVVLDETDRLLQKSNQQETQKILSFLARADKRQTLLFSATFPRAVRRLVSNSSIMSKNNKKPIQGGDSSSTTNTNSGSRNANENNSDDFLEVDCIGNEETTTGGISLSTSTSTTSSPTVLSADGDSANQKRVEESFVGLENMSQFIPSLLTIIRREQERNGQNYKILVFFPAGRIVRFLFQFFTIGGLEAKDGMWEIHSRMSQSSRTRASSSFREARKGILFSSDVSARGLDYPDVSLVVQMGAPSSDKDYIHRIGRTGRAGKVGKGLLVLLPFETKPNERRAERNNNNKKRRGDGSSSKRRSSSSQATFSYRNDANLEEDLQLARWLKEPESSESLYQTCNADLKPTRLKVRSGHVVLTPGAEASYKTFLAHYVAITRAAGSFPSNRKKNGAAQKKGGDSKGNNSNINKITLSSSEILDHAQDFVKGTGLAEAPLLDDEFSSKLGLTIYQQDGNQ